MGKFNFANRKAQTKTAAVDYDLEYGEDQQVTVRPKRERPVVSLDNPASQPASPTVPARGRGLPRRDYSSFGDDSPAQVNPPLGGTTAPQQSASSPATPKTDPLVTQMKHEMVAWIKAKYTNPNHPEPAKTEWFDDAPISKDSPKFVPLSAFFRLSEKIISPVKGAAAANEWASRQQREATGLGAVNEESPSDLAVDSTAVLPHAVDAKDKHTAQFASSFADRLDKDPRIVSMLGLDASGKNISPEARGLVTDAAYAAFGPGEKEGNLRNDVKFFLKPTNLKFLPPTILSALQSNPAIGQNLYQIGEKNPDGAAVRQAVREYLTGEGFPLMSKRLTAMALYGSGKPGDAQRALKLDPSLSQLDPNEVGQSMLDRAVHEFAGRYKNFKKTQDAFLGRNDKARNKYRVRSLQDATGTGDSSRSDYIAGGDNPLNNAIQNETGSPAGDELRENSIVQRDQRNDAKSRSQEDMTDIELEKKSREVSAGLRDVASQVRSVGRDIASFMTVSASPRTPSKDIGIGKPDDYWTEGRPQLPNADPEDREKRIAKANRFKVFTDSLAQELELISRNTAEGRERLKKMLKGVYNRDTGKFNSRRTSVPHDMPLMGDHAELNSHFDANPQHKDIWNRHTPQPGQMPQPGGDFSDVTNAISEDVNGLLSDSSIISEVKKRVAKLMQAKLSRRAKALDGVSNMKQIKDELRQDFALWGPFLLLDPVREKYDAATRRILTDVLPIRGEYMTGSNPTHGTKYPVLYHAVRDELHKLPQHAGWGKVKNPPEGQQSWTPGKKTWTPPEMMSQIEEFKQKAMRNLAMKGIERRWRKGQQAKGQLQAMKSRMLMMKVASADLNYIDAMISHADAYIARQYEAFFRMLGA